ncbi:hypothetical protein EGW08_019613 [Elysia chlorotica]|uniref:Protein phosphatase 1 regulatory subunit 35 C-terminal domain-containing protein n=1 Tax=Elysia chlorotica TaxID=188477 RepID=A0A3S1BQS6_ELYCH|nr:hypothetical protein EGW08_019613 [Elysia chlorotica]
MPASGKAGAVSDYEHLNNKYALQSSKQVFPADDSADSDFLPLKPSKLINKGKSDNLTTKAQQLENFNSNNATASVVRAKGKVGLTQLLDDFGHLQSMKSVPVPTAWSPGMMHVPNPALFITPEKHHQQTRPANVAGKENLSELQTSSGVPVPVAWSPGMVLRPNPALMVTPEKATEQRAFVSHGGKNPKGDTLASTNREKPTVRFDLPSASSRETSPDTSQDFFTAVSSKSPITLKGCELQDNAEPVSPSWKAFSPHKSYNPDAYSDDSVLENSIQGASGPPYLSQGTGSSQKTLDIEETTSDRLADKLQELLMTSSDKIITPGMPSHVPSELLEDNSEAQCHLLGTSDSKSASRPSRKVISASVIPHHPKPNRSSKTGLKTAKTASGVHSDKPIRNAGPEYLKTAPSAYEPRLAELAQPHVLREWDSSPERNNYSFPFETEAVGGGADLVSEHAFARPEYNSTLRVRSELDDLCSRGVDVEKAVSTALTKSETKRTELSEKASMFTNRMSDQFGNLVDLDPSVESLCSRAVRMRTSRVRSKKPASAAPKSAKSSHTPPDLMEFLPPDLQKESPDFSLPGIKTLTSGLLSAPPEIAFDLYRHNRVWLGINDY